jgi:hypothetical protein
MGTKISSGIGARTIVAMLEGRILAAQAQNL